MSKIKLFGNLSIDIPKLIASKLFVYANSGFGKSWLLRWFLEQTFGKVQQIIIDPEGEFSTLREKFDYILIGKGAGFDIQADPRTAALLAHRLLQEGVSAIIDIYELEPGDERGNPGERDRFVANFSRALVNAPKDLWHPYIYVVDEAQDFAPEKGNTLAHAPLLSLAKKGRKRGCCPVFATQRVADFSKSVIAACNNKMIGQASLDIDMKRCAAELGFTTREEMLSLRDLDPGEFFVFGPAISKNVQKVKIGSVQTSHPDSSKIGGKIGTTFVPASDKVKRALAKLADIPQEMQREEDALKILKEENGVLKRENTILKSTPGAKPEVIEATVAREVEKVRKTIEQSANAEIAKQRVEQAKTNKEWQALLNVWVEYAGMIRKAALGVSTLLLKADEALRKISEIIEPDTMTVKMPEGHRISIEAPTRAPISHAAAVPSRSIVTPPAHTESNGAFSGPEQSVLDGIKWMSDFETWPEQTVVATLAGYSVFSSSFIKALSSLRAKGMVESQGKKLSLTVEGDIWARLPNTTPTRSELHDRLLNKLDGPCRKIMSALLKAEGKPVSDEDLATAAEYSTLSSSYIKAKSVLRGKDLMESEGKMHTARSILFI